jgi:hypothetical protein
LTESTYLLSSSLLTKLKALPFARSRANFIPQWE